MSDRDRIAAIVRCERWHRFTQPCDDECSRMPKWWDYSVADALIAAGATMPAPQGIIRELREEWRADFGYDGHDEYDTREEAARNVADYNETNEPDDGWRDGEQAVVMRRYVTEWEPADE